MPNNRADNFDQQLRAAIEPLRNHYAHIVLPMWRGAGFNATLALPFEALIVGTSPTSVRYRAMACARQLYIFTEADDREHADKLFASLINRFQDPIDGGFFYSVDANGEQLDTDKDLYTHAFVIFACATYGGRFAVDEAKQIAYDVFSIVRQRFSLDLEHGLPNSLLDRAFSAVRIGVHQNPLMHLTEALLTLQRYGSDPNVDEFLASLLRDIVRVFVEPTSGCVMELPTANPESWIEPGHQFEWFFLAAESSHAAFIQNGMTSTLTRAFDFAQRNGVSYVTGGVAASLHRDGSSRDKSERIWAQTEYLRALAWHPDVDVKKKLTTQIELFRQRFLHAKGWYEVISAKGDVTRVDMPSTTPYHLFGGYSAIR